jgi:hypothetical protein
MYVKLRVLTIKKDDFRFFFFYLGATASSPGLPGFVADI